MSLRCKLLGHVPYIVDINFTKVENLIATNEKDVGELMNFKVKEELVPVLKRECYRCGVKL